MNISDFLNEQYSNSALYINYRSTPSYIDGLKNSARKVVYTAKRNNIKSQLKVATLGSKVVESSGYIHGEASIYGTIITMAQNFCGSNNLPVLTPIGSFGTRHIPEAAAPRYIFTKPSEYFDLLFRKEDDCNLIKQEFEGEEIEPMFYVPSVPLLLVNGSYGIGVGFSSTILARDLGSVIKATKACYHGKKVDGELLIPSWNGFDGEVSYLGNSKWEIKGKAELNGRKLLIKEVPISYSLTKYLDVLRKLKEKGVIDRFVDCSENDKFEFEITLSMAESKKELGKIMSDLKLVDTITENLVCIDEHNAIREFSSIEEILSEYCKVRVSFLDKRIKSEIKRLEEEERYLFYCHKFVSEVVSGTIDVKSKSKKELEKLLGEMKYESIDKLISMPIYSLTTDKVKELEKKLADKYAELEKMRKETPITVWDKDLAELEKKLGI